MKTAVKIGIIKEGKTPPDSRVALKPKDIIELQNQYPQFEFEVQASVGRCIPNEAYQSLGIKIVEDVQDCDILLGVKEVPYTQLIPNKTYFFFSHTIKEQPYNQNLMQALIQQNIRMIDYETLVDKNQKRLIGFGFYAGVVGAHHALMMYGKRTEQYFLLPAKDCLDYEEMIQQYKNIHLPQCKIVLTGTGKVAQGSRKVLEDAGIKFVSPEEYLTQDFDEAVFTHLTTAYLYKDANGNFDKADFYQFPEKYTSAFLPYAAQTDILINGIFWNESMPRLFETEDIQQAQFSIKSIADISCDILGSVPINTRASSIADPVYAIDKTSLNEVAPYQNISTTIDLMTVDNLPNELPRDASEGFSQVMKTIILPELLKEESAILEDATICENGNLCPKFEYLHQYAFETV